MAGPSAKVPRMAGPAKRSRLSAEDWITAALTVIRDDGMDAVAVEPLAERLGVTKGSFYAHFANRDELVHAALRRWEADDIERVERIVADDAAPEVLLQRIIRELFDDFDAGKRYAGVCAAGANPLVAPYALDHALRKIDLFRGLHVRTGLSDDDARRRSELLYTAFIGYWRIMSMFPPGSPGVLEGYVEHLTGSLLPDVG